MCSMVNFLPKFIAGVLVMAGRGKVKRILSDSEDYDSKPNSEAEAEEFSCYRPVKKKKMCSDSGSESDSALHHKDTQKHDEELNSASDEDEPLEEVADRSKRKGEQKVLTPSDTSDDEFVAKSKISVKDLGNNRKVKNLDTGCKKNGSDATSDEDEPLKSRTGKSKVYASFDSSDDEPLAAKSKSSPVHSDSSKKSSNLSSLSGENRLEASDDDDEPISKVAKTSKFEKKSKRMQHYSFDSSGNEPVADKKKIPTKNFKSKNNAKSLHSDPENNELEAASDKDKSISQAEKSTKAKAIYSSDSSDDEPLAAKKISTKNFESENKAKNLHSDSENDELEAASDKDKTINEITKSKDLDSSSCNSDDEPLAVKNRNSSKCLKTNKKFKNLGSHSDENKSEISSDEEPLSKITKASKASENSKTDTSNSDSEDEPLVTKSKGSMLQTNSKKDKNHKPQSVKKGHDTSSGEEKPIHKIAKASKKKHNSGSSSDDESLSTKVLGKQKSKPQKKDGAISFDEEDKPVGNLSKLSKGKSITKKDNSSSNRKVEHLKKYLRVAGIHINSYDKLFEGCKSIKSKTEKLLGLLHEKGLKGRPTIEKCKKLKKKIETKKEIAELDKSNIIKSEGRPRRGAAGRVIEKVQNVESSPATKKFSRLRDIIDSEESD